MSGMWTGSARNALPRVTVVRTSTTCCLHVRAKQAELKRVIAQKAKSDEKAERLCQEISSMKAAKVALLKRMKEDSVKYR